MTLDETVAFVRSFMLFSMLANLAEDRQGGVAERDSLASAVAFLQSQGIGVEAVNALLEKALITPVLTAHPTEVMRKSMLDHRNRIAALLRQRDAGLLETASGELIEEAIGAQIALLWQTRALRHERLYVADEVDTALAYLRDVFIPVLPALYARWERVLQAQPPSFLRLGSWIGGDRDGNPHVTADSLRLALGRASQALLADYLEQLNALGAELSLSSELAANSPPMSNNWPMAAATSIRRAPTNLTAAPSPACTRGSRPLMRCSPARRRIASQVWPPRAYADAAAFAADLRLLQSSLDAEGSGRTNGGGPLPRLLRAVETFGFHLATLDFAPEFGRARARGGRIVGRGRRGSGLSEFGRTTPHRSVAPRTGQRATAGKARLRIMARKRCPNWPSSVLLPRRSAAMGRHASRTMSFPSATASRTCSR